MHDILFDNSASHIRAYCCTFLTKATAFFSLNIFYSEEKDWVWHKAYDIALSTLTTGITKSDDKNTLLLKLDTVSISNTLKLLYIANTLKLLYIAIVCLRL